MINSKILKPLPVFATQNNLMDYLLCALDSLIARYYITMKIMDANKCDEISYIHIYLLG